MFILNEVGILYPYGVPSAPFGILVSHRLFSPVSRCERCPFLSEVLYWIFLNGSIHSIKISWLLDDLIYSCRAEYLFIHYSPPHFISANMQNSDFCNTQVSSCKYTLTEHKTVWILIRWLNQKSADLDAQCFQETEKCWFSKTGVKKEDNLSLAWFYHTSAPAKLQKR